MLIKVIYRLIKERLREINKLGGKKENTFN